LCYSQPAQAVEFRNGLKTGLQEVSHQRLRQHVSGQGFEMAQQDAIGSVADCLNRIGPLDGAAMERARDRLADLTKPLGSLGRLETLILQLAGIQRRPVPTVEHAALLLFAGDHGVAAHGVSRYGAEVTEEMTANIAMGGAVSSVVARADNVPVRVVDVGMSRPVRHPAIIVRKVRPGTSDITVGPAMTTAECRAAADIGAQEAQRCLDDGADCLLVGEMGIGNSTAMAALASALLHLEPEVTVGAGTGLDAADLDRKRSAVRRALVANQPLGEDPWEVMAKVGGLELAALGGALIAAAAARVPVLLDGAMTAVAALWAARLTPGVVPYLIASHESPEPAHRRLLDALRLDPLVRWDMRLGEGSGALLMWPTVRHAARIMAETLTFADARVSNPHRGVTSNPPSPTSEAPPVAADVTAAERDAVYKVMYARRDIRSFLPDPIPEAVLDRILAAAHAAPSVGLMQPWNFIVIQDRAVLRELQRLAEVERLAAAANYDGIRRDHYLRLKVEGLLDAPLTLCVTNDPSRGGRVLGRNTIPETDLMSTACAIENLWLAARAEGLGLGWVSFFKKEDVRAVLGIPDPVQPAALLCLGYTAHFPDRPLLERVGWEQRRPLSTLVYRDRWGVTR
jgi:nicotinate-nucleotide--dimethylbenzimidazole phosphoribosyltransferase